MSDRKPSINRLALGKALTRAADASVAEILSGVVDNDQKCARRVGITGPPGAGKSSLIRRLCTRWLKTGERIGVIAVDPSSPFTFGAVLGDRVRMESVSEFDNMFIRSIASRGAGNGLADNMPEMLNVMDAFGFDRVILETVGAGQEACAVANLVDTTVLVLNPQSGDHVQAMKAGILEAADIVVINKADLQGADATAYEIEMVVKTRQRRPSDWCPLVLQSSHGDEQSTASLDAALAAHEAWLKTAADPIAKRRGRRAYLLASLMARRSAEVIRGLPAPWLDANLAESFNKLLENLR